jgi:hypothetical protein
MNAQEAPHVGSWYCTLLLMMNITFVVYKFVACICFSVIGIQILKNNTSVFFTLSHEKPVLIRDVCGSVHHSKIHKEKSNNIQQCIKILLSGTLCLIMSTNYTSNNLPRMKNQRLPMQF